MFITQQANSRRLIYSMEQLRRFQNQDFVNKNSVNKLLDENHNGRAHDLLESDENQCYLLGYN